MESELSFPCTQEPATSPYSEVYECSLHPHRIYDLS
jgi:hypothetical protein